MVVNLFISAIVFFAVSRILPGFRIKTFGTAIVCAIVMAIVSTVLSLFAPVLVLPFLAILLPAAVLGPLGVMAAVAVFGALVQAVLLIIVDKLIEDFEIDSPATAFIASFLMAGIHVLLRMVVR